MSNTFGHEPSGSPLGLQYRQWVLNMAQDIQELNRLKPLIEFAAREVVGGGGAEARLTTFPAIVNGTGVVGTSCNYHFFEVGGPWDPNPPDGDYRSGLCTNTLEAGVVCPEEDAEPKPNLTIPPGIGSACLPVDENGRPLVEVRCHQVGHNCHHLGIPGCIVTMHEMIAGKNPFQMEICGVSEGDPMYFFSVPIPFCIKCIPEDDDDGGGGGEP